MNKRQRKKQAKQFAHELQNVRDATRAMAAGLRRMADEFRLVDLRKETFGNGYREMKRGRY